jgi:hypothetical protein
VQRQPFSIIHSIIHVYELHCMYFVHMYYVCIYIPIFDFGQSSPFLHHHFPCISIIIIIIIISVHIPLSLSSITKFIISSLVVLCHYLYVFLRVQCACTLLFSPFIFQSTRHIETLSEFGKILPT